MKTPRFSDSNIRCDSFCCGKKICTEPNGSLEVAATERLQFKQSMSPARSRAPPALYWLSFCLSSQAANKGSLTRRTKHLAILPAPPSKVTHISNFCHALSGHITTLCLHLESPSTQSLALEKTPPLPHTELPAQWPPSMPVAMVCCLGNHGAPPSAA